MLNILMIEDDSTIAFGVKYALEQEGFNIDICKDLESARNNIKEKEYSIILLDVMLPDGNGYDFCKEIRENNETPVIFLTACDEEVNIVMGLDIGGDDYMTKPFSSREVVSKIKAIIRRKEVLSSEKNKNYLGYGSIKLDNSRFEVLVNGQVIDFTLKEYELLEFLIQHKGQAMSRDVLLDRLWGFEYDGDTRIVDVHIFKIREKLKDYGIKIKTIRGIGYMLEDEVHD